MGRVKLWDCDSFIINLEEPIWKSQVRLEQNCEQNRCRLQRTSVWCSFTEEPQCPSEHNPALERQDHYLRLERKNVLEHHGWDIYDSYTEATMKVQEECESVLEHFHSG